MFAKLTNLRLLIAVAAIPVALLLVTVHNAKGWKSPEPPPPTTSGRAIYLSDPQPLGVTHVGERSVVEALADGSAQPLSLASIDLDADGVEDLVVGYATSGGGMIAVHRGNLDAFAPQSEASFQAVANGQFPSTFLPNAEILSIPVRPDFMALGRFTPDGHEDLVVAAIGENSLYLFQGDGKGSFGVPQTIALPGGITTMAAENLQRGRPYSDLVVGVATSQSSSLLLFSGSNAGITPPLVFPLKATASNIVFGDLDGDSQADAAFLSGGHVFILHSSNLRVEELALPVEASAMALGSFIFDRTGGSEIALLALDGTLHIAAHTEFDPRPLAANEFQARLKAGPRGYENPLNAGRSLPQNHFKIVESLAAAAPFSPDHKPVLFRTRISDHGADDVMLLNPSAGQLAVISHPDTAPGATTFLPAEISTRPYSDSPVAALSLRTNIDGRPGVVELDADKLAPAVMMPLPDPTFTVNRTDDPTPPSPITNACNGVANDCSLREAILRANAVAGTDTVNVPAGTYTLTLPRVQNDCTGNHGALSVNDSVNIVGAGQGTTIIQAGTTNTNGIDMVMNVNEDLGTANCPVTNATASISNLTMKFGRNHGTVATFDGDGGCMEFDTGSSGNANLVLDHVTLTDCSTTDGNGGGIASFNVTAPGGGTGLATITNSIFQNNTVAEVNTNAAGSGGAIWVSDRARMSMSNSQILNNNANQVNGTGRGVGGGLFIFSAGANSRQTVLHSNIITGNHASGDGGGIWSTANLLIDNGGSPAGLTVISGNTAGGNGGGIHYHAVSPDVMTLSKVTITGNTATGAGGGIDSGEPSLAHAFSMSFSRVAGNTAASGSNLNNNHSTATVTNNWWGTDAPSGTLAGINGGSTTFDPFIVLTNSATAAKIRTNQSSTLAADMSKDNHGNGAALTGNLDVLAGLPITFDNVLLGSVPQAQPETLNASAQATATFNAGATSGRGSANGTDDQGVVGANSNLVASATEAGTTATITTVGVHNFAANETVVMTGMGVAGYNGTFTILSTPTPTTFTYTAPAGLATSSGGAAKVGIIILEPPQITKSFGAARIAINGTTTVSLSINNPNIVAINSSFTDTLPTGLQVAGTPGVVNNCGGAVTAAASSNSISFSNNLTPIGTCTITVNVTGTVDNNYTNSVSILSTDAGNGNTSSASLTVINPPHIAKAFGTSPIVFGQTTSLTFTLDSNSNQNLTITGAGFTDSLPAGMIVATPNGASTTCSGAAVTAVAGSSTVTLAGASIPQVSSCTVTVNVTGVSVGSLTNSVTATSTNAGTGNTATATLVVNKADTTVAVQTSGSPSVFGQSVTFTATISVTSPGAGTPTGNVTFKENGVNIGTCAAQTVSAGLATCSITTLGVGSHPITAVYNGDSNFNASPASPTTTQVVNKADTTVAVTTSASPSVFGQSVTLTATISVTSPGAGTPTGNVTFKDNGVTIGTCTAQTVSSGKATCVTSVFAVGTHPITAVYNGDSNFNASPASPSLSQVVNQANTTVSLTSAQNPSVIGQSVTFTATIAVSSPGSGTPTGNVTFQDNLVNIGTCASQTVTANVATCTVAFAAAGSHPISATYNGDTNFASGSGNLTGNPQVVNDADTWNGSVSSDWNTPGNWSTGFVPTAADKVAIPSVGVTNQPNLGTADATIISLTLNAGTSLTISGNHTLLITSTLTMNGNNINDLAGTLELGPGATISRTSGVILGNLKKDFQSGAIAEGVTDADAPDAPLATFTFPVGTAAGFFPVDVTPTGGSTGSLTVQTFDGQAGVVPPLTAAKTLGRYWTLTGGTGITADVKFSYEPGTTINGTEANYKPQRVTGGVATSFIDNCPAGSCVDETNHFIFMPQISTFAGNWTASELAPTAAMVGVSGRVLSADGRAIRGVRVVLDDGTGHLTSAISNAFGYYHFDAVQSGGTYLLNASARGYTFAPVIVSVNDELTNVNLTALP